MKKTVKLLLTLALVAAVVSLVLTVGATVLQKLYYAQYQLSMNVYASTPGFLSIVTRLGPEKYFEMQQRAWEYTLRGDTLMGFTLPVANLLGAAVQVAVTAVLLIAVGRKPGKKAEVAGIILLCGWGFMAMQLGQDLQLRLHATVPMLRSAYTVYTVLLPKLTGAESFALLGSALAVLACGISLGTKVEKVKGKLPAAALVILALVLVAGLAVTCLQKPIMYLQRMQVTSWMGAPLNQGSLLSKLQGAFEAEFEGFAFPVSLFLLAMGQVLVTCLGFVRTKGKALPMALAILLIAGAALTGAFMQLDVAVTDLLAFNHAFSYNTVHLMGAVQKAAAWPILLGQTAMSLTVAYLGMRVGAARGKKA